MGPASLVSMVQSTIGRNISSVQDLGDIPYDLVRPILKHITNPEQLRQIELASPQIAANDQEIWRMIIAREIPDSRTYIPDPTDLNSVGQYSVYCRLKEEDEKSKKRSEEQLRRAFMKHDQKKEENKTTILNQVIQQDVRSLPQYADGAKNPHYRKSNNRNDSPSLRNAKKGQIIGALRQQSRQAIQQRKLAQPFGKTPMPPPQKSNTPQSQRYYVNGESRGERSLRLALEEDKKKKVEVETKKENERRQIKKVVRRERAKEENKQAAAASTQTPPPSTTRPIQSIHNTPPRSPSPPKVGHLTPPPNPLRAAAGDRPQKGGDTLDRDTPSPPKRKSANEQATSLMGPDPAAHERKSGSPIPELTLNDGQEKPKVPVYTLPAARRRPVSIFAPKPKPKPRKQNV